MTIYPVKIITEAASCADAKAKINAYAQLFNITDRDEIIVLVQGVFKDNTGELVFLDARPTFVEAITGTSIKWRDNYRSNKSLLISIIPADPTFTLTLNK